MQWALEIAERGRGNVKPNPLVGCVLVKDGDVIAEGWHDHLGGLHAEQMAIHDAEKNGRSPNGAHAFVTLEPCNHHGRTPPCTEALLWSGVSSVVIAHVDPNPTVRGGGIEVLRNAGIEVRCGLLEDQARRQMQSFLHWCEHRRPLVTLKMATDADGAVDDRSQHSRRFSSEKSLDAVHSLRSQVDAILVGVGTVARDDPQLTVRRIEVGERERPLRVVLDRSLRIPDSSKLLNDGRPTLLAHVSGSDERVDILSAMTGVEVVRLPPADEHDGVDIASLLALLGDRGHQELLVEGGPDTASRFIAAGMFDRVIMVRTKAVFEEPLAGPSAADIESLGLERLSDMRWGADRVERWSRLEWPTDEWP